MVQKAILYVDQRVLSVQCAQNIVCIRRGKMWMTNCSYWCKIWEFSLLVGMGTVLSVMVQCVKDNNTLYSYWCKIREFWEYQYLSVLVVWSGTVWSAMVQNVKDRFQALVFVLAFILTILPNLASTLLLYRKTRTVIKYQGKSYLLFKLLNSTF